MAKVKARDRLAREGQALRDDGVVGFARERLVVGFDGVLVASGRERRLADAEVPLLPLGAETGARRGGTLRVGEGAALEVREADVRVERPASDVVGGDRERLGVLRGGAGEVARVQKTRALRLDILERHDAGRECADASGRRARIVRMADC